MVQPFISYPCFPGFNPLKSATLTSGRFAGQALGSPSKPQAHRDEARPRAGAVAQRRGGHCMNPVQKAIGAPADG